MVSLSEKASQKVLVDQILPGVEKYKDSTNSKFRVVYMQYVKDIGIVIKNFFLIIFSSSITCKYFKKST